MTAAYLTMITLGFVSVELGSNIRFCRIYKFSPNLKCLTDCLFLSVLSYNVSLQNLVYISIVQFELVIVATL